nr:MAG TPA: hypothetical protein [Caudoviricetes sp.]
MIITSRALKKLIIVDILTPNIVSRNNAEI